MFAYCNNNPVIAIDSCGGFPTCCVMVADSGGGAGLVEHYSFSSELSISISRSSVLIDAYIEFEGDIDKEILIKGIKDYWEGDYDFPTGTKALSINIHCGHTDDERAIHVSSIDGCGRSSTWPAFRDGGSTTVMIYSRYGDGRSKNIGWSMAHEFGHCLGIDDYYTHAQEGWYNRDYVSIMHHINDHAQIDDVYLAIQASKTGQWQKWN